MGKTLAKKSDSYCNAADVVMSVGCSDTFPAVVPLNVGGVHFAASLDTLRRHPSASLDAAGAAGSPREDGDAGNMLSAMFSGRMPVRRDGESRFFIDRDGRHFHHILNYLRDGSYPVSLSKTERRELEREASFFGLSALAAHLRADLPGSSPLSAESSSCGGGGTSLRALEAADLVLNRTLEEWPEFPQFVQKVLDQLLEAAGVSAEKDRFCLGGAEDRRPRMNSGVVFDEETVASLQFDWVAIARVELAHADMNGSKTWRWSDRHAGVNSVLRAKLLRCHLQRLGYACQIVPVYDKKEVTAYVLQVEIPIPS